MDALTLTMTLCRAAARDPEVSDADRAKALEVAAELAALDGDARTARERQLAASMDPGPYFVGGQLVRLS